MATEASLLSSSPPPFSGHGCRRGPSDVFFLLVHLIHSLLLSRFFFFSFFRRCVPSSSPSLRQAVHDGRREVEPRHGRRVQRRDRHPGAVEVLGDHKRRRREDADARHALLVELEPGGVERLGRGRGDRGGQPLRRVALVRRGPERGDQAQRRGPPERQPLGDEHAKEADDRGPDVVERQVLHGERRRGDDRPDLARGARDAQRELGDGPGHEQVGEPRQHVADADLDALVDGRGERRDEDAVFVVLVEGREGCCGGGGELPLLLGRGAAVVVVSWRGVEKRERERERERERIVGSFLVRETFLEEKKKRGKREEPTRRENGENDSNGKACAAPN